MDVRTVDELDAVVDRLRRAGPALRARPLDDVIASLGRVGARFLDETDPVRRTALANLPSEGHLSAPMAVAVLDGMAADWTEDRLRALVKAEFHDPSVLDGWVARPGMAGPGRVRALGPALCFQIVSGSVPGVSVHALIRSLVVRSPTLLKPGRGDALLPGLFARALREEDPAVADALTVAYWPGGAGPLERKALEAADVAVIYGSDATVEALRARAPATTRIVAYHHRVAVGVVGREALEKDEEPKGPARRSVDVTAAEVARAVAVFEQRGCVCPRIVFVEAGGSTTPSGFARALAGALDALEDHLPSVPRTVQGAATLAQMRGTAEMHQAAGRAEVHHGGPESPWTVVFEAEALALPPSGPRTVHVRPVEDVARVPALLQPIGPHLQSVGHAGLGGRLKEVADALGEVGASRVVPFRAISFPPPWWLHDGRGPLETLVRWVEVEEG